MADTPQKNNMVPPDEDAARLEQLTEQMTKDLAKTPGPVDASQVAKATSGEAAARLSDSDDQLFDPSSFDDTGENYMAAVAASHGMEMVVPSEIDIPEKVINAISPDFAKKYRVIPVALEDNVLRVALSDPNNLQTIDDLNRLLDYQVIGLLATETEIQRGLERFYESNEFQEMYEGMTESDDPNDSKRYEELELKEGTPETEQPAVVRYVDLIFRKAVHDRASDIHIEPNKTGVTIRFRIDGVLNEIPSPPRKWQNAIISRLKVLAGMDLAEKRIPLDGRIRLSLPDKKLDLRVSTLPTIYGESIVMRILDQENVLLGLEDVGFLPETMRIFSELIETPNGVILMTGPTGSGKTTTLYAALNVLNTPETKLVTLEDPVEYMVPGINQVQIQHDVGLDFANGLRALLRQSPDVILVGEIRDQETAENAIRAALTGHLVFSTLHTNDAPSATTRLIDMGIKPYLVASSIQAVIAQRLVRRLCGTCKEPYAVPDEVIREFGLDPSTIDELNILRGKGCERCGHSGYRGRTAIHEVMVMNTELRRRVIRNEAASRLKKAAVNYGMRTLRMDGWEKVLLGQTSAEEVMRITQED